MKNTSKLALVLMVIGALSMSACQTLQGAGAKESIGSLSGAAIGGILGSKVGGGSGQLWATGAGAVIGGLIGKDIGRSLDNADRGYLNTANNQAHSAPVGETVAWNNPESGNSGTVTTTRDGYSTAGRYCREYQQTIVVGGREERAYGTACQQADGSWEIVG